MKRMLFLGCFAVVFAATEIYAAELRPETVAAFERYVRLTEERMADDIGHDQFLIVDRAPQPDRDEIYRQLQEGDVYIEEVKTQEDGHSVRFPGGMVHHWAGVIFIHNRTLSEALAVLQDYEHAQDIYKPDIRQSKLIERNGSEADIYLQFFNKSLVTVVLNANFHVSDTQAGSGRYQIASYSTRIAETKDPSNPDQFELPVGRDHGYMWRLNTYWRIEEKDGGVYLQNESIELSRSIPPLLIWLVRPLTKSIPRNLLVHLLEASRNAVERGCLSRNDVSDIAIRCDIDHHFVSAQPQ